MGALLKEKPELKEEIEYQEDFFEEPIGEYESEKASEIDDDFEEYDIDLDSPLPVDMNSIFFKKSLMLKFAGMSKAEQDKIILKAKAGDTDSIVLILNGLFLYAKKKAVYYSQCTNILYEDYFQECMISVLKSIDRYDVNSEAKFLTFAAYYIHSAIVNYRRLHDSNIRVPSNLLDKYYKVRSALIFNTKNIELEDALEEAGLSKDDYERITNVKYMRSLNFKYGKGNNSDDDDNYEMQDKLRIKSESFEDIFISNDTKNYVIEYVRQAMETLTEREKLVVLSRCGFFTEDKPMTLIEIGKGLGISKEGVRKIEARGFEKIKKSLRKMGIETNFSSLK